MFMESAPVALHRIITIVDNSNPRNRFPFALHFLRRHSRFGRPGFPLRGLRRSDGILFSGMDLGLIAFRPGGAEVSLAKPPHIPRKP
jgi:hypothetical protein